MNSLVSKAKRPLTEPQRPYATNFMMAPNYRRNQFLTVAYSVAGAGQNFMKHITQP